MPPKREIHAGDILLSPQVKTAVGNIGEIEPFDDDDDGVMIDGLDGSSGLQFATSSGVHQVVYQPSTYIHGSNQPPPLHPSGRHLGRRAPHLIGEDVYFGGAPTTSNNHQQMPPVSYIVHTQAPSADAMPSTSGQTYDRQSSDPNAVHHMGDDGRDAPVLLHPTSDTMLPQRARTTQETEEETFWEMDDVIDEYGDDGIPHNAEEDLKFSDCLAEMGPSATTVTCHGLTVIGLPTTSNDEMVHIQLPLHAPQTNTVEETHDRGSPAKKRAAKFKDAPIRVLPSGQTYREAYYTGQCHVGGRGRFGVTDNGTPSTSSPSLASTFANESAAMVMTVTNNVPHNHVEATPQGVQIDHCYTKGTSNRYRIVAPSPANEHRHHRQLSSKLVDASDSEDEVKEKSAPLNVFKKTAQQWRHNSKINPTAILAPAPQYTPEVFYQTATVGSRPMLITHRIPGTGNRPTVPYRPNAVKRESTDMPHLTPQKSNKPMIRVIASTNSKTRTIIHAPVKPPVGQQNEPPNDYVQYDDHAVIVDDSLEEQIIEETIETSTHLSALDQDDVMTDCFVEDHLPANILDD